MDVTGTQQPKTILITSDHGGFELKEYLIKELADRNYDVKDLGPKEYNPNDDYPDIINHLNQQTIAPTIVICKNGVGVSVLTNKIKGVRCALSWNPEHAKSARLDDDANFLALPADYITKEIALQTALAFLQTPFSKEKRHIRRLEKLAKIDL